jgi:hypothetical protein
MWHFFESFDRAFSFARSDGRKHDGAAKSGRFIGPRSFALLEEMNDGRTAVYVEYF